MVAYRDGARLLKRIRSQLQEAAIRRTERACISRFASTPVTAMRSPTWFVSFSVRVASTSSIFDGRFFRNPNLQLRDFGASTPDASFSKNVSPASSRHPVIVAGADTGTTADSATTAGRADSVGRGLGIETSAARVLKMAGGDGAF